MSWTRLDDTWTDSTVLADLDFADRWHYLAMIQFCSRTGKVDGQLRVIDARRCSDHPEPDQAVRNLADAELVTIGPHTVTVNHIADHVPPPSVRENAERSKIRMQRMRKHRAGDHSECLPDKCEQALQGDRLNDVTRNTGTGRDGTGQDRSLDREASKACSRSMTDEPVTSWEVASIPASAPPEQPVVEDFPPGLPPVRCHTFNCSSTDVDDNNLCPAHRPDVGAVDEFERIKREQLSALEARMKESAV